MKEDSILGYIFLELVFPTAVGFAVGVIWDNYKDKKNALKLNTIGQ